jgi:beta-lactamase class A
MRLTMSRRALLAVAALLPLAGCGSDGPTTAPRPSPAPPSPSPSPSPSEAAPQRHDALIALEQRFGARLGVYALATGTGATVAHRADERFAFCSTFKALATAAVLHRRSLSGLDTVVTYTRDDLLRSSFVTRDHVATGMTIRALCDAAVRHSDGTAGNLLVRDLGGPQQLTAYLRGLGDTVTRMDRMEPDITAAVPGDERDTTSPRALGADFQRIVLGDALPAGERALLRDLLERNTTGARRIRAGTPRGWTVADKTGTGSYGTANDIAVVFPPSSAPLIVAIMSSKPAKDAAHDEALIAEAARYVTTTLGA